MFSSAKRKFPLQMIFLPRSAHQMHLAHRPLYVDVVRFIYIRYIIFLLNGRNQFGLPEIGWRCRSFTPGFVHPSFFLFAFLRFLTYLPNMVLISIKRNNADPCRCCGMVIETTHSKISIFQTNNCVLEKFTA